MEYDLNDSNVTVEAILLEFERLDNDFFILNKSDNVYLQILPLGSNFTVEVRLITIHSLIRHYRIGMNPSINIWHVIYNTISGQISLKESELLNKDHVRRIITDYINENQLYDSYYKRNISKEIGLM